MVTALAVLTATVFGTLVGVEFSVVAFTNPMLRSLPAGPSLELRAAGARTGIRVMPLWYSASLLLVAGLAAARWGTPAGGTAVAAAALLIASVILSLALLVPLNNRTATWTADDHPGDWREQHQRWDRLHWARVAIILAAFVLALVAVAV